MSPHSPQAVLVSNRGHCSRSGEKHLHLLVRKLFILVSMSFLMGCNDDQNGSVEILHPPTLGPTPTLPVVSELDLSASLTEDGTTSEDLLLVSSDGWVRLEIPAGTKISDASGEPIDSLSIIPVYSGKLPMDAYGYAPGFAYEFGPDEIYFIPDAKLVFLYTDEGMEGIIPSDVTIGTAYGTEAWKSYSSRVDMGKREIRINVGELLPGWRFIFLAPVPIGS